MSKIPDTPQLVPVELLKPHTHEGQDLNPGDTINLLPDQAEWLASLGVAKPAAAK